MLRRSLLPGLSLLLGLSCLLLGACARTRAPVTPEAGSACPGFDRGRAVGRVTEPAISEASGLVASREVPGVWWTHNDSGDVARVFALDAGGRLLGIAELEGIEAVDWEDLAIGPGPEGSWLSVGDIGDNPRARKTLTIHRFPEPIRRGDDGPVIEPSRSVESWTVRYEDHPHDAETLLVDPRSGETFLVTKERGSGGIYRIDLPPPGRREGGEVTARKLGEVDLEVATAGDVSPSGRWILLRGYREGKLWRVGPDQDLATALAGPSCPAPLRAEPQGESIAFSADGESYATLGERTDQPLWVFRRAPLQTPN